jgi:hypothetical protein
MPVDVTSTLREALSKLAAEKRRIERQAAAIHEALQAVNGTNSGRGLAGARVVTRKAKRSRRRMSATTRKLISARMKASWAKRKKATSGPRKGNSTK